MVLDMLSVDNCAICGANLRLVGRSHRCVGNAQVTVVANKPEMVANVVANRHGKYADLDKRRAYMRAYMAKRRATDHP